MLAFTGLRELLMTLSPNAAIKPDDSEGYMTLGGSKREYEH
jgi:hypothetical protein